jgi:riboflavin synthase
MFTGLIKDIGTIKSIKTNPEGKEFTIEAKKLIEEIKIDDSVATNGVCLTATEISGSTFKVQAVHVTLDKTTTGKLTVGSKVNLELALRPMDRLGGHFVQGHVNGVGKIMKIDSRGKNFEITISAPTDLRRYMISEGSIALEGISLTISKLTSSSFSVSIIPHTWDNTVLHTKKVGDSLNIEVDMMAKYLENFVSFMNTKDNKNFNLEQWAKDQK